MENYEKLGLFYLGKEYNIAEGETTEDFTLYRSKDLCTHALCLGMTGSGKTGLCVSLLEEAAIDGVPIIAIDPKGDLSNLLLSFEKLDADSFAPWVSESEANQKDLSIEELASQKAKLWTDGIASWDQDASRISRLHSKVDMRIYTPGDDSGLQLSLIGNFKFPGEEVLSDIDALSESVENTVTSFISLIDSNYGEAGSPEHTFVSQLILSEWNQRRSVSLPLLIGLIQNPPFEKVGVLDVDTFFPKEKRTKLALRINSLLASPQFKKWSQGNPLKINSLLYGAEGKPQISVISIAHLSEKERIFFVSRLLNDLVAWVRKQDGTSSLRALVYMDEIYGYFPPTANPPTKKPMLTLLKQARAHGLGVVLATQNPVDLDYKGLSNIGTWFVGRLQTERDKNRLLEGLKSIGSSGEVDWSNLISSLKKRVFLLHNVNEKEPRVFHTRWALSFLTGPLGSSQISKLMNPFKKPDSTIESVLEGATSFDPRTLPKEIKQKVYDLGHGERFKPVLAAQAAVEYTHRKSDQTIHKSAIWESDVEENAEFRKAEDYSHEDLSEVSFDESEQEFSEVPANARTEKYFKTQSKALEQYIYRSEEVKLLECSSLKLFSEFGESRDDFMGRVGHKVKELRDKEVDKLQERYERKFDTLEDRITRAEQKVEVEKEQYAAKRNSTAVDFGLAVASAIFGGRVKSSTLSKAGSVIRGASRTKKEKSDISRAQARLADYMEDLEKLKEELEDRVIELEDKYSVESLEVEEIPLKPKKTKIDVDWIGILWKPRG